MDNTEQLKKELYINYLSEIIQFAVFLLKKRKEIVILFIVLGVLSSGISLLIPNYYTAKAVILPSGNSSNMGSLLSSLGGNFIGYSSEESMSSYIKLYPLIGKSRPILSEVLKTDYNNMSVGDVIVSKTHKDSLSFNDQVKILRKKIDIVVNTKLNFVEITVIDRDPAFAASIANVTLTRIDSFFMEKLKTSSGNKLNLIEKRLVQVTDSLSYAENALREFKEKNRITINSPKLIMEERTHIRSVEIYSTLLIELTKQRELAVIDNMKDTPILNRLHEAYIPEEKSGPARLKLVATFVTLGMLIQILYLFIQYKNGFRFVRDIYNRKNCE